MNRTTALIDGLLDTLFEKDHAQLAKRKTALIQENQSLGGVADGFLFNGVYWSDLPLKMQRQGKKTALAPQLKPAVKQLAADYKTLDKERTRLRHGLNLVLKPCVTDQDVRDALPDEVAPFIPSIARLSRTKPEAWSLQGNALHQHQYQDTAELLSFYAVNQMLY